jgi:periplasmic protein TonB
MNDRLRLRADAFSVVQGSADGRGDSLAAVVPARMRQPLPATITATLGNVVPFLRPRATGVHAPHVVLPTDVARLPVARSAGDRLRHAAFVVASIVLHGAIFAYFVLHEPPPLASIGVEVISAELVLGATAPAGAEQTKGDAQQTSQAATDPEPVDPQRQAEQKATEQPQNVQVAPEETAPEQTTMLERQADEQQPADNAAAPREERQPAEPKYSLAMVENPSTPEIATAAPKEIPPDTTEVSLLPQPDEKPVEKPTEPVQAAPPKLVDKKPDPQAPKAAAPKPVKDAKPAKDRRRVDAPTREKASKQAKASDPSLAASNVGVGRSNRDTNYKGIVWAHLARQKQSVGANTGSATVSFTIGGSGGVSGVRLARASGVAAIDQEVQAMVRRASPFPPPPGGRSEQFIVPVSFR